MKPMPGTARRAADIREDDFRHRGFRDVATRVASHGSPRCIPDGAVYVEGRGHCGRIVRAGLTGPMIGCGAKCECVKERT